MFENKKRVGRKFLNTESPENYMSKSQQKTRTPMNVLAPFFGHLICETDCLTWWTRTILVNSQEGIAWNRAEPTDATILDPDGPWSNYTKTKMILTQKRKPAVMEGFDGYLEWCAPNFITDFMASGIFWNWAQPVRTFRGMAMASQIVETSIQYGNWYIFHFHSSQY